jgi:hypothetical protein
MEHIQIDSNGALLMEAIDRLRKVEKKTLDSGHYETSINYTFDRLIEILERCSPKEIPYDMDNLFGLLDLIEGGDLYPAIIEIALSYLAGLLGFIGQSDIDVYRTANLIKGAKLNQYLLREDNPNERYIVLYPGQNKIRQEAIGVGTRERLDEAEKHAVKVVVERVAVVWIFGVFSLLLRKYHRNICSINEIKSFDLSIIQKYNVNLRYSYGGLFNLSNMKEFASENYDWDYVRNYEIYSTLEVLREKNFMETVAVLRWERAFA